MEPELVQHIREVVCEASKNAVVDPTPQSQMVRDLAEVTLRVAAAVLREGDRLAIFLGRMNAGEVLTFEDRRQMTKTSAYLSVYDTVLCDLASVLGVDMDAWEKAQAGPPTTASESALGGDPW